MKVQLLSHTLEPEKLIAGAANICYSSKDLDRLMDDLTPEKSVDLVNKLIDMQHESPLEHVTFTFGIEEVSRVVSHQLVRHRIASYSQRSQRYVNENNAGYVIPESIKKDRRSESIYKEYVEEAFQNYQWMIETIVFHKMLDWAEENWPEFDEQQIDMDLFDAYEWFEEEHPKLVKEFEKAAQEDARYLLPNACHTSIVVTMNARSLINFFHHRCCKRAQEEIRTLAWNMLKLALEVAPALFKNAGPACLYGPCPEKSYSCQKPYSGSKEDIISKEYTDSVFLSVKKGLEEAIETIENTYTKEA